MISKDTFIRALQLIREQDQINRRFEDALQLVGNGHYVFGVGSKLYDALLLVLKEAMNDRYDYIEWWLYEGEPDFKVCSADDAMVWDLRAPEALYDFIATECQPKCKVVPFEPGQH